MSNLNYPEVSKYNLPKKNILVIGCIDLRLTDNLVDFLNFDNLHNRFDYFTLAGASLTHSAPDGIAVVEGEKYSFDQGVLGKFQNFGHWKNTLYNHIDLAILLHKIQDVYIVEHEDCGAYAKFLQNIEFTNKKDEVNCHKAFATALADHIHKNYEWKDDNGNNHSMNAHCFLIDLRGNVELLYSTTMPQ
ncbi:hypothetical protein [uncultured Flavobacterium sp.]|uniref:hypothetical protein n=1 Tax=uncultured Flavobacterium sp. TaxID=165435 RepID=UPI0025E5770E|nr:hypothetical protein [uncultured Flavobacterium sp.]